MQSSSSATGDGVALGVTSGNATGMAALELADDETLELGEDDDADSAVGLADRSGSGWQAEIAAKTIQIRAKIPNKRISISPLKYLRWVKPIAFRKFILSGADEQSIIRWKSVFLRLAFPTLPST